jgi:hypothetical protein
MLISQPKFYVKTIYWYSNNIIVRKLFKKQTQKLLKKCAKLDAKCDSYGESDWSEK